MRVAILIAVLLSGCSFYQENINQYTPGQSKVTRMHFAEKLRSNGNSLHHAYQFINYSERSHRQELRDFIGVDPVRTEWCAAFVNAVLGESGIPGSDSVSNYPLTARSFLDWGESVESPMPGDLVIFPRGNEAWQGHVGFYLGTSTIGGKEYYQILGGNQSNKVSIELYPASRALGIRRYVL